MSQQDTTTKFSIPYIDRDLKFWKRLSEYYSSNITDVYFPVMDEHIGTGRPRQPQKYLVEFLESGVLPVSLLINPVVLPDQVGNLVEGVLRKIMHYRKISNLKSVTLANLTLAKQVKKEFPDLPLIASTLMEIYNEQQLALIGDVFDTLVPSNRILRDIRGLEKLRKAYQGKIRLLVNESCLSSCVFRTQHFYEMSNSRIAFPDSLCNDLLKQKPWLRLTGNWVLPQHLYLFDGLYDELKIAGRVGLHNPRRYIEVLEAYILRKAVQPHTIGGGPAAVHIPIDIDPEFYKHTLVCEKNCNTCSFCSNYWSEKVAIYE